MKLFVLKPDEIGDFVMSLGCLHLLADVYGEEHLGLAVKSAVAPLARREFPAAEITPLALQRRRKGGATGWHNFATAWPLWWRWRGRQVEAAACLRARRTFFHNALFVAPRARQRVAAANPSDPKPERLAVEWLLRRVCRTSLVPYPDVSPGWPTELESHRRVASVLLGREVGWDEILPRFRTAAWRGGGGFWLLCPFSSRKAKDYPVAAWAEVLKSAAGHLPAGGVRLGGAADQRGRLEEFSVALRGAGVDCPVTVEEPVALDVFPDVVASTELLLTVDTAAAHFAAALGAPAVIVSCGVHPGVYGPYSPNGQQIWLVGDWERGGAAGWAGTVPPSAVTGAIRSVWQP